MVELVFHMKGDLELSTFSCIRPVVKFFVELCTHLEKNFEKYVHKDDCEVRFYEKSHDDGY